MAIFVLALNDLANPLRMINPESQNIGKPVINPVIPIAAAAFLVPVFFKMLVAILMAPPDLSSTTAMMAPKMIRKPMEAIVEPNPSFRIAITFPKGRVARARNKETMNSETKAFSLMTEVSRMISKMLIRTRVATRIFFTAIS